MTHIVYVKFSQITELTHKDVLLKDVAQVYCKDKNIQNKCSVCKVMTVRQEEKHRYVANSLDIVRRLEALDPGIQVTSMGEEDFIIAYKPPAPPSYLWQWAKTGCVCAISFFGAAFAIMTFNNDVSVTQVFSEVYRLVMGGRRGYCPGSQLLHWPCIGDRSIFQSYFFQTLKHRSHALRGGNASL